MEMNTEWYNTNEHRKYPVASHVSTKDNDGDILPTALIADLAVVYNDTVPAGDGPYLSSLVIGPSLVTVSISLDGAVLVSESFTKPVTIRKGLPLKANSISASGYIVFGIDINDTTGSFRFSSAAQSGLDPKAARKFSALPITSLAVAGDSEEPLTDIISLIAKGPIDITHEGNNVVSISLKPAARREFLGPCDNAISPDGCGPAPLRRINGVGPDSNGNIFIEVE
jgi:hypothetical protein